MLADLAAHGLVRTEEEKFLFVYPPKQIREWFIWRAAEQVAYFPVAPKDKKEKMTNIQNVLFHLLKSLRDDGKSVWHPAGLATTLGVSRAVISPAIDRLVDLKKITCKKVEDGNIKFGISGGSNPWEKLISVMQEEGGLGLIMRELRDCGTPFKTANRYGELMLSTTATYAEVLPPDVLYKLMAQARVEHAQNAVANTQDYKYIGSPNRYHSLLHYKVKGWLKAKRGIEI